MSRGYCSKRCGEKGRGCDGYRHPELNCLFEVFFCGNVSVLKRLLTSLTAFLMIYISFLFHVNRVLDKHVFYLSLLHHFLRCIWI